MVNARSVTPGLVRGLGQLGCHYDSGWHPHWIGHLHRLGVSLSLSSAPTHPAPQRAFPTPHKSVRVRPVSSRDPLKVYRLFHLINGCVIHALLLVNQPEIVV